MRSFHTSVTDLRQGYSETIETLGYECGWAGEAIFFVTAEDATPTDAVIDLEVQLSADGIRWLDEGSTLRLTGPSAGFIRLSHFGGFLRLRGTVGGAARRCLLTIRLALKE